MKKKRLYLAAAALALLALTAGFLLHGRAVSLGRCVVAESGTLLWIDGDQPVVLHGADSTGYATGDRLLILHDNAIEESYPAQTHAYAVWRVGGGSAADIPPVALDGLRRLGWLKPTE